MTNAYNDLAPIREDNIRSDRLGAALLLSLGLLTVGIGVYFTFFRPAMLPEDIRFTGVRLQTLSPQMAEWLRVVFQTWGAFMVGFGTLMSALAIYLLTRRPLFLRTGIVVSIVIGFTRFLVSNVVIGSDYVWFVGVLFAFAVLVALHTLMYANYSPKRK